MTVANARLNELTDDVRQELEALLLGFDQSWSNDRLAEVVGTRPVASDGTRHVLATLPPAGHPLRLVYLIELVKVDLERHWQHGRRLTVEDYLADYPELGTPTSVAANLLQTEYEVRQQFGAPASLADFAARFPLRAEALKHLLEEGARANAAASMRVPATVEMRTVETTTPSGMSSAEEPPDLPEQFGRYRIVRKLGQGSMGTVYLAHDNSLGRAVALKVPRLALDGDRKVLERFYREARAAATLEHPHLCPVYDVGEINGTPYLTMAFVEGRPLSEILRDGPRLAQPRVAALLQQLALALQEAHARGVIHRDLKPANVMMNARGEPVVMDFGLARRAEPEEVRLTHQGSLVGTPAYMAPEQVQGKVDTLGPTCDVYALGVILYEALAGRLPFQGTLMAVLGQIVNQEPEPLGKVCPDVDPALEAICHKAMAKKPEERYASMSALAGDLGMYLQRAGMEATPAMTPAASRQPPRRSYWLRIAAASAAMLALVLGVVVVIRHRDGSTTTIKAPADSTIEIRADGKPTADGPAGTQDAKLPADPSRPAYGHPPGTYVLGFDGRKSRVRIPKSSFKFYGDHSLTIEATLIPHSFASRQEILCDLAGGAGLSLALRPAGRWTLALRGPKNMIGVDNDAPVTRDHRVQLAAVLDRERRKIRLFVDGKLNKAETTVEHKFHKTDWDTILGADPQNPGNRFINHFDGVIEQVRISKSARYAKDYVPKPMFAASDADEDTLLLYLCNEGEGNILHDSSPRKAHARIEGAFWEKSKP